MTTFVFPGQGSQYKGMGKELFDAFPNDIAKADTILGYSVKELCLEDPQRQLHLTQYTQPALYVVNALMFFQRHQEMHEVLNYVAGHSLGEYNALLAAEVFDFETGLRLVKQRGLLMSQAVAGGMAAVMGLSTKQIHEILKENHLENIDIANYNSPSQIVISGLKEEVEQSLPLFEKAGAQYAIPLNVSSAFHSHYMQSASEEFLQFLQSFEFHPPKISVISNVTARPYQFEDIRFNLAQQISHPVQWNDSIRYLMGKGETQFQEVGPRDVLTKLVARIQEEASPIVESEKGTEAQRHKGTEVAFGQALGTKQQAGVGADLRVGPGASTDPQTVVDTQTVGAIHELPSSSTQSDVDTAGILKPSHAEPFDSAQGDVLFAQGDVLAKGSAKAVDLWPSQQSLIPTESLGSEAFRKEYGVKYAYVAGAMYKGIGSKEIVIRMGKAGLIGFLGAGGLSLERIEDDIRAIQEALSDGEAYGMNLLCNLMQPKLEEETVRLYLKYGIRNIEAAAYMQMTPALVWYRLKGLYQERDGSIHIPNRVIAKVSRPEVAEVFLKPAPERIVQSLLEQGLITSEEAELSKQVPMSHDICVEADSGGHTDQGVAYALMPAMQQLRDTISTEHQYSTPIRVGAAGGIGTPEAAAAAFMLGADFILTGSINQCTVESGTSSAVKDLLQEANVQDVTLAPAGDMFEIGAKVQVFKKGLLFPARANKLYDLYQHHDSIESIDEKTQQQIQERYFHRSFNEVWEETKAYYEKVLPSEIERAEKHPKHQMALIFRWYFIYTNRLAMEGDLEHKVDYQIHCGPALGAFNQWVKGSPLEDWRQRHVDDLADLLMQNTAHYLSQFIETKVGR